MTTIDRRQWLLAAGAACVSPALRAAEADGAAEIARRSSELDRVPAWTAEMTLEMLQPGGDTRTRRGTLANRTREGLRDGLRLFRVSFPADLAGTAVLTHEYDARADDTWLYLPALKKARRIVASSKRDSFLGSEFAYVDMARARVRFYRYRSRGDATVAGTPCHVVEGEPVDDATFAEEGYTLVRSFVAKDTLQALKVEYHDARHELFKTQTLSRYAPLGGAVDRSVAQRREMLNHRNGQRSVITLANIATPASLPEALFTEARLGQE